MVLAAVILAGLIALAVSRLNLSGIGHALITASLGWIAAALVLMASSLLLRSLSWDRTLRAALPTTPITWPPVMRATMIGVMASALFPGRIGEPTRVLVLSRRLEGPTRTLLPVIAGTVFSQTLINLLALGILLAATFTSVPIFHGHVAAIGAALIVPATVAAVIVFGPRVVALGRRSHSLRVVAAASALERLLGLVRSGLRAFARPRYGVPAVGFQLAAWALQWLSCYAVILALGLEPHADVATAAAILLAVNLSAILPATPSNVGVFQAACVVVLAAYGIGAAEGVAYGLILQAVEVVTALGMGIPALLGEGLHWRDLRPRRADSAGDGAD